MMYKSYTMLSFSKVLRFLSIEYKYLKLFLFQFFFLTQLYSINDLNSINKWNKTERKIKLKYRIQAPQST